MEIKPKVKPVCRMEGTFFDVDIDNRQFIKTGVPGHSFSFDHMVYQGTHYLMAFDTFREMPATLHELNGDDVVLVKIPQLKDLDPEEISAKYGIPAHELKYRTDFEIMVNLKALAEREKGVLPSFEILGKQYAVDLDNYCFKLDDHTISLKDFKPLSGPYGDRYAHIDSLTHQVVKIDIMTIKEMPPEHIVKVVIPSNDRLDPYYIGKNREPDLKTYLLANPMIEGQKAAAIPLSQTTISAIVKSNVERELRRQFEQTQRINKKSLRRGINS